MTVLPGPDDGAERSERAADDATPVGAEGELAASEADTAPAAAGAVPAEPGAAPPRRGDGAADAGEAPPAEHPLAEAPPRGAEVSAAARLAAKPVLEWTAEDWAQWIESTPPTRLPETGGDQGDPAGDAGNEGEHGATATTPVGPAPEARHAPPEERTELADAGDAGHDPPEERTELADAGDGLSDAGVSGPSAWLWPPAENEGAADTGRAPEAEVRPAYGFPGPAPFEELDEGWWEALAGSSSLTPVPPAPEHEDLPPAGDAAAPAAWAPAPVEHEGDGPASRDGEAADPGTAVLPGLERPSPREGGLPGARPPSGAGVAETTPHRVRSALSLLVVSVLVGTVVAGLVAVTLALAGIALRRAVG